MTEQVTSKQEIYKALRDYASMGLPIIPLCTHDHRMETTKHKERCACAGKIPRVRDWEQMSSTTNAQIKSWIQEFEEFNLGLVLGDNSGYVGVDVDGFGGEDMLEELSNGDLPETWSYRTGDGFRLLYSVPSHLKTKKFVNQDKSQKHTECSILAAGQQTVVPPSMHHTGYRYEWDEGHSPWDIDCAPAPKWLLDLVVVDEKGQAKAGTIDLTSDNPTYEAPEKDEVPEGMVKAAPLIIVDSTVDTFFMEPDNTFNYLIPFNAPEAKGKSKSKKEDTTPIMEQYFSEGGRDNGMIKVIGHLCAKYRDLGKDMLIVMAQQHNLTHCTPPLEADDIADKVQHIWEREEVKTAEFNKKRKEPDENQFVPYNVAQVALNLMEAKGGLYKISSDRTIIWYTNKNEGPWRPAEAVKSGSALAEEVLPALLEPEYGGDPKWVLPKNIENTLYNLGLHLKMQGRIWDVNTQTTNTQTISSHKYIPLKGGRLLDWRTGELHPWDPETNLTYTLPIDYDPTAKCPNWEMRLAEWLPDEDTRKVVQEFIGYSFIPYMGFEKVLIFQGEGANGKSMFLETITEMFNSGDAATDVIGASTLADISDKFGKIDLLGKIINIANEAGADYLRGNGADELKNLVSGGAINAQVKLKNTIRFTNTAKFIFSSNHDIKTGDKSLGWERRLIIVPFTQNFSDSGVSKHEIMESFKPEYPGIFNWAVEGLRRLIDNGKFTESEVITQRLKKYTASNDIAVDFQQNCLRDISYIRNDRNEPYYGVSVATMSELFKLWIDHGQSEVKKHKSRIQEHLEKQQYKIVRREGAAVRYSNAAVTRCWGGLDIHITDATFLESCLDPLSNYQPSSGPLREYMIKRLQELNGGEPLAAIPIPQGAKVIEKNEAK